jgi:hypothetical protein
MILRILDEAVAEFADAIAHYEDIESGLGIRFRQEVQAAASWIENHPELPNLRPNGYRRVNLKVFPYYVAYMIQSEIIWILAIAHSARRPEYWIDRNIPV